MFVRRSCPWFLLLPTVQMVVQTFLALTTSFLLGTFLALPTVLVSFPWRFLLRVLRSYLKSILLLKQLT